jgi:serine phosphatase RsbU (regulator of sigma subunit)
VTGLARHAIRTAALATAAPADVLATRNRVMFLSARDGAVDHFCTALPIFARPRRDRFTLTLAAGGHPSPMIVRADGQTTQASSVDRLPGASQTPPSARSRPTWAPATDCCSSPTA